MARVTRFPGRTRQVHRKRKPVTCFRCGWTWVPYGRKRPARCANATCRSPYWSKPRRDDRADRLVWEEGDLTITGPDGEPLADEEDA